jgi:hypothetical protein
MAQFKEFKNKTYLNMDVTLGIAQKEFAELAEHDPQTIAFHAGVRYLDEESEFIVPFLNEEYRVRFPSGEVYQQGKEVPGRHFLFLSTLCRSVIFPGVSL